MKNKAIIISHGGDPDGIISAALIYRNVFTNHKVEFVFIKYSKQEEVMGLISLREDLPEFEIFVADLSINDYLVVADKGGSSILERLALRSKKLTWADHHVGTMKFKSYLEKLGGEVIYASGQSASKIISSLYCQPDSYSVWLSNIADISDYPFKFQNKKLELISKDLYNTISLYLYNNDYSSIDNLAILLSLGNEWYINGYSKEFKNALKKYHKKCKTLKPLFNSSVENHEFCGVKFLTAYGPGIFSDKDFIVEIMEKDNENKDCYIIAFGVPYNNALVLRGSKSAFPVIAFSSYMGGGGRKYCRNREIGGFSFDFQLNKNNYNKARDIICLGLKDYLTK